MRLWRFALVCLICLPRWGVAAENLPSFDEVRAAHPSSFARLLDRDGTELARVRLDPRRRRLAWMPLSSLGQPMKDALLAAEDRRFFQHSGIDWRAFAAAVVQNLWFDHARGASTLTMQLAGLLEPSLRPTRAEGGRRSLTQKWDQAWAATELERRWNKSEILEAYLNLAPLRGDLEGIPAAAHFLFAKSPGQLDHAEAAIIAALLRAPNALPQQVARRACILLASMHQGQACNRAQRLSEELDVRAHPVSGVEHALAERLSLRSGDVLTTTLSSAWQRYLMREIERHGDDRVAMVLDNASGGILAWGSGESGRSLFAMHPAARTFAWLQLAEDLGDGSVTPATLVNVGPAAEPLWISTRQALSAMRTSVLDHDWIARLPHELQARVLQAIASGQGVGSGRVQLPSLEADVATMASMARALANGGAWQAPVLTAAEHPASSRLSSEEGAFLLGQVMREDGGRQAGVASLQLAEAGGHWELAFDRSVSIAAWVSADTPSWLPELLRDAPGAQPLDPARAPVGLVSSWVRFDPPVEWPRREWFLRGSVITVSHADTLVPRIRWPSADSTVLSRQLSGSALYLQAEGGFASVSWRLDGALLGSGRNIAWVPRSGLHMLELLGAEGEVLDSVWFAVADDPY